MNKSLISFYKVRLSDFFEALINIVLFLPYFFSVPSLFKTLFYPWKNLVARDKSVGFSFQSWLSTLSFNLISASIGFIMRSSIIFFYFLLQTILLILLPFIFIIFLILIPLFYLQYLFAKTEEQSKEEERLKFIGSHLLNQENYSAVAAWFEDYYKKFIHKSYWWSRNNLFSLPPLARDWAAGFTPSLDLYGQDLTSSSYQDKTITIVNREKEIDQMERALSKTQDANVLVVGEEGVGKHTVIVALAKRMYEGKTKSQLMYKRIIRLNMEKILNQYTDAKQRENFFEELLQEAGEAKNIIIFIDSIDQYISSDKAKVDMTTSFEKLAKSNQIQFIGITTPFLYEKFFLPNERLSRLFAKIDVLEVTPDEAEKILLQLAFRYEQRYQLTLPFETIKNAIQKSDFYITSIPFPEKAIDLLDSACVLAQQSQQTSVSPEHVDKALTEKTHVPTTLTENTKEKLIHLETLLTSHIVQQKQAVSKLSSTLRRSFLLMGKRKKPLASLLFLGPTGVGKTETAKSIARIFFGGDTYLVRFDMSNYQSHSDIPNLIGSIDTGNPGLLAKAIRENPYGVLLLDEIEKANPDLINIFLTLLDEGYFTDGFGKRVDCKNLVVIATSNAGSEYIYKQVPTQNLVNYLIEQKIFSPEFLNRFDAVVVYKPLDNQAAFEIAKKMLEKINTDIFKLHKVKLKVTDEFLNQIIDKGYDQKFGARNLERLIRDEIEDKIAKLVLENRTKEGQTIQI